MWSSHGISRKCCNSDNRQNAPHFQVQGTPCLLDARVGSSSCPRSAPDGTYAKAYNDKACLHPCIYSHMHAPSGGSVSHTVHQQEQHPERLKPARFKSCGKIHNAMQSQQPESQAQYSAVTEDKSQ